MFRILAERARQKYRTVPYPAKEPILSSRFRGRPRLAANLTQSALATAAKAAESACPTGAFATENGSPTLDMGRCLFCGACEKVAPELVSFSESHRLAALSRGELIVTPQSPPARDDAADDAAATTAASIRKLFRRSFRIRQVSAAGCNACEADCNVLTTVVFDLARFGIDFVASPRHADAVLVTGPVPRNIHLALHKCYNAMPSPKVVIAVGACAISGGLFAPLGQEALGVTPHYDADLFIPGCPPSPYTILDGLLRFLHRTAG